MRQVYCECSFDASAAVSSLEASSPPWISKRRPGEKRNRDSLPPHWGSEISPDPDQDSRLMRHRRSVGHGNPPLEPREALLFRQKRVSCRKGTPVSPKKRKIFTEEAIWSSNCPKAARRLVLPGWWMRRSAATGPMTGECWRARADSPIAAIATKCFRGARDCYFLCW